MSSPRRNSAVYELDLARFGGPTTPHERTFTVGITETELVKPNPDRLMLIIANNGTGPITFSMNPGPTPTSGLPLGAGALVVFSAFDDGAFVAMRFYAIAGGGPQPVTVVEIERSHGGS